VLRFEFPLSTILSDIANAQMVCLTMGPGGFFFFQCHLLGGRSVGFTGADWQSGEGLMITMPRKMVIKIAMQVAGLIASTAFCSTGHKSKGFSAASASNQGASLKGHTVHRIFKDVATRSCSGARSSTTSQSSQILAETSASCTSQILHYLSQEASRDSFNKRASVIGPRSRQMQNLIDFISAHLVFEKAWDQRTVGLVFPYKSKR
jgi:hypothetical protein